MGLVTAKIELSNARDDALSPMQVEALVDSGAAMLCLPAHVALQLRLPVLEKREATLADGRVTEVDYVGPVHVRFENRQCLVGALVLGDQPLLGAIPMEDMDLVISPMRRKLTVNPASPNMARSLVMRAGAGQ